MKLLFKLIFLFSILSAQISYGSEISNIGFIDIDYLIKIQKLEKKH